MTKVIVSATLCLVGILWRIGLLHAGGALETLDITGRSPSPIPGQIVARVIGVKLDTRAIPVQFNVNSTIDPIPNPLGPAFLSLADATAELRAALDVWNDIPTSFIEMRITGVVANPGLRGFDFVNEVTFRTSAGFGLIAAAPFVSLMEDTTFVHGDDIDEDGDSDVSQNIVVTTDVDGDGDLEFPAGFYKAGTMLDSDVELNTKTSNGYRFTTDAEDADRETRSVDLLAIAAHEFGHSHGLSHSMNDQSSVADGAGATMFPIIDTGDPVSELAQRTLDVDDIAYSSFFYPEGTARKGAAALQSGDIAFQRVFSLISGRLRHGVLDQPLAGGHVFAVNVRGKTASTGAFSGATQLSLDPVGGGLSLVDAAFNIVSGRYVIPVPRGRYRVGIEPVDGQPVPATAISATSLIGLFFGQQIFNEEVVEIDADDHFEFDRDDEDRSRFGRTLDVRGTDRRRLHIVTSRDINIDNFGSRDFLGFVDSPPGRIFAVCIPASQITAVRSGWGIGVKAAAFDVATVDASVAPMFAEAMLTTGVVNADGTASVDLANPLAQVAGFVGQDNDLAPLFFSDAKALGRRIRRGIHRGRIQNLFLALRIPTTAPFPGVSGLPPLIGLDGVPGGVNDTPIFGLSFLSDDGGATFGRVDDFNFRFSLRLAEATDHGEPDE